MGRGFEKLGLDTNHRYLVGEPIRRARPEGLVKVLKEGTQRQRAAAAIELKLIEPNKPLFEVRAAGIQQQRLLGLPLR